LGTVDGNGKVQFETISRVLVWRQIVDQIGAAIVDGDLAPGEELPTERELCERFGVSRASTREALRVLEAQGLIVSHETRGRTVAPEGASGALQQAMRQLADLHAVTVEELVDFRCLIEGHAVRVAAKELDEEKLAEVRAAVEEGFELSSSGGDPEAFEASAVRFHVALVAAGGNNLMALTIEALRPIFTQRLGEGLESVEDAQASMHDLAKDHEKMLEQVEKGKGERAATLLERHIRDNAHFQAPAQAQTEKVDAGGRRAKGGPGSGSTKRKSGA
jgi:GntR family transcriptional regulator, transcriptional repressor for pyruvate dehydrogenase complex